MGQTIPEGEVPVEIKLVNEFLNTLNLERYGDSARKPEGGRDDLRSHECLKEWLVARGLLGDEEAVTEADRELAVALRGVLRSAASANGKRRADSPSLDGVDPVLEEIPLLVRLREDQTPRLAPGRGGVHGALGRILADVAAAAARGTWTRLRICDAEDCRWAYYDHSKSRTGRWCSMRTCGNRAKTRRYRQRHKATGGS